MDAALVQADRTAVELKLSHRDAMHLRLLVEKMMDKIRSIIGELEGKFWIETDGAAYRLYLQTVTLVDTRQRAWCGTPCPHRWGRRFGSGRDHDR